jgi:hypothetical protein
MPKYSTLRYSRNQEVKLAWTSPADEDLDRIETSWDNGSPLTAAKSSNGNRVNSKIIETLTGGTPGPADQTIAAGGKAAAPAAPTQTGYTLLGWFTETEY